MEFVYCLCGILFYITPKWHLRQNIYVMERCTLIRGIAQLFRLHYKCHYFLTMTSILHNYYRHFQSLLSMAQ